MLRALSAALASTLLLSCSGNPLEQGVQTSYCEAVCDWAVACASADRTVDAAAERTSCLEAARAADPSCADAESGKIDIAHSEVLTGCTAAVQANIDSGNCEPFEAAFEQTPYPPPTECAAVDPDGEILDDVRDATEETNEELCERLSASVCDATASCLESTLGADAYAAATEALGVDASQMCQETAAISGQTQSCTDSALYEATDGAETPNTARAGARDCLEDLVSASCADLLSGKLPATCAAAFTSTDELASFGGALVDVATAYKDSAAGG